MEIEVVPRIFPVPIFSNRPGARNSRWTRIRGNESPQPFLVFSPPQLTGIPSDGSASNSCSLPFQPPLPSPSAGPAPAQKIETISSGRRRRRRRKRLSNTPGSMFPEGESSLEREFRGVSTKLNGVEETCVENLERRVSWKVGGLSGVEIETKFGGFRWRKLVGFPCEFRDREIYLPFPLSKRVKRL